VEGTDYSENGRMSKEDFTREFAEMLSIDPSTLTAETDLTALPEWDSVAYLSAMVLIDEKLSLTLRPEIISNATRFGDILSAVEGVLRN
jgi:acyl carrier protein